jgi:hypothetical protein
MFETSSAVLQIMQFHFCWSYINLAFIPNVYVGGKRLPDQFCVSLVWCFTQDA